MSDHLSASKKLSVDEALVVIDEYIGRDWGDILDAARVLAAEVKQERARIDRDNKTFERTMRRQFDDGYREGWSEGAKENRR
jgi:hypothetical protein